MTVDAVRDDRLHRISLSVENITAPAADPAGAIAGSMIGTHVIAESTGGQFVSLLEPPPDATAAVTRCRHRRCFPVLAGAPGENDLLLISPIILYDHPPGGRAEQRRPLRFDGDRRDPHPAGDDHDRRGKRRKRAPLTRWRPR